MIMGKAQFLFVEQEYRLVNGSSSQDPGLVEIALIVVLIICSNCDALCFAIGSTFPIVQAPCVILQPFKRHLY